LVTTELDMYDDSKIASMHVDWDHEKLFLYKKEVVRLKKEVKNLVELFLSIRLYFFTAGESTIPTNFNSA
jgi:hypothetical protein